MDSYGLFLACYAALAAGTSVKIELIFEQIDKLDKMLGEVAAISGVPEPAPSTFAMDVSDEDAALELEVARVMKAPLSTFDASQLRRRWLNLQNRPILAAIFKAAMLALASKNPALAEVINGILATVPQKS